MRSDLPDYRDLRPEPNETREHYAKRLQSYGHEEMFIRKALAEHFSTHIDEMAEFFEAYPDARVGHLKLIEEIFPGRYQDDDRLARKVTRNLGISRERAEYWVARYREAKGG